MRFNPKRLVVSLAAGGFIAYAVDQPKKPVVTPAEKRRGQKPPPQKPLRTLPPKSPRCP